jgi:hypothetical protein
MTYLRGITFDADVPTAPAKAPWTQPSREASMHVGDAHVGIKDGDLLVERTSGGARLWIRVGGERRLLSETT